MFFVLHLTGDPARLMLGSDASAEAIAAFRHQWGLDKPLWEQFGIYLLNALSLDMGKSYATGLPVKDVFLQALGPTLDLMIPTAIVTLLIGIPAGVFAALRRNTTADRAMMVASVMGYAVPNFFMGILLLLVFSIWLGWLPSYGNATAAHYIMPIITMATTEAAIFSRYARSAMIASAECESRHDARSAPHPHHLAACAAQRHALDSDHFGVFPGYARGGRRDHRNGVLVAGRGQASGAVRRQP